MLCLAVCSMIASKALNASEIVVINQLGLSSEFPASLSTALYPTDMLVVSSGVPAALAAWSKDLPCAHSMHAYPLALVSVVVELLGLPVNMTAQPFLVLDAGFTLPPIKLDSIRSLAINLGLLDNG